MKYSKLNFVAIALLIAIALPSVASARGRLLGRRAARFAAGQTCQAMQSMGCPCGAACPCTAGQCGSAGCPTANTLCVINGVLTVCPDGNCPVTAAPQMQPVFAPYPFAGQVFIGGGCPGGVCGR